MSVPDYILGQAVECRSIYCDWCGVRGEALAATGSLHICPKCRFRTLRLLDLEALRETLAKAMKARSQKGTA